MSKKPIEKLRRFTSKFHGPEILKVANDSYHGEEELPLTSWLMSHRNLLPKKFGKVYSGIVKWAKSENVMVTGTPSSNSPTPLPVQNTEVVEHSSDRDDYGPHALSTLGEGLNLVENVKQIIDTVATRTTKGGKEETSMPKIRQYIMDKHYWNKDAVDNLMMAIDNFDIWKAGYLQRYQTYNAAALCLEIQRTIRPDQVIILNSSMSKGIGVDKAVILSALQSESVQEEIASKEANLAVAMEERPEISDTDAFAEWSRKCAEEAAEIKILKGKNHKVLELLQDM